MKIEFNFQSPYAPDGKPRQDLPKCEVLATDGERWICGELKATKKGVSCYERYGFAADEQIVLHNVQWFTPLPTIYTENEQV